jgi:hypothetical protein
MSNVANRLVIYNDGEGADHADFNRHSIWQAILESDYKLAMMTRTDPDVNAPWQEANFTQKLHHYHQQGCVYSNGTSMNLRNKRGLIAQWTAAPDGTEPKLLCYFLDDDEINLTSAAADPTNPRYDVIAVKLVWQNVTETRDFEDASTRAITSNTPTTYKQVVMTARIITGTPAASPTIPALAAGEAYYAVYRIPAAFTGTISLGPTTVNEFRDFSFPIGEIKSEFVMGSAMLHVPADWTVAATGTMTATAGGKIAKAGVGLSSHEAKILNVQLSASSATLGFTYGVQGSGGDLDYGTIASTNVKNFADFSAIDVHTCKPWIRNNGGGAQQPRIKVTTASTDTLNSIEIHYK